MDKFGHELIYQDFLNHPVWQRDDENKITKTGSPAHIQLDRDAIGILTSSGLGGEGASR